MEFTAAVTVQDLHLIPSSLRNMRRTKTGANVKIFMSSEIVIVHVLQHSRVIT